jgi:RNA recognition motif-containing protein
MQTKLFVGNLSFDTTLDELRALFVQAGEVVNVTLPTDRDSGRPRGFAFVEMATGEQAAAALEKFNGFSLQGRALRVDAAAEKPARGWAPRHEGSDRGPRSFPPGPRSRPKGSRRNLRARKRSL